MLLPQKELIAGLPQRFQNLAARLIAEGRIQPSGTEQGLPIFDAAHVRAVLDVVSTEEKRAVSGALRTAAIQPATPAVATYATHRR